MDNMTSYNNLKGQMIPRGLNSEIEIRPRQDYYTISSEEVQFYKQK